MGSALRGQCHSGPRPQPPVGHGELEVRNATHAHWSWHTYPDLETKAKDEVWLVKGPWGCALATRTAATTYKRDDNVGATGRGGRIAASCTQRCGGRNRIGGKIR